MAAAAVGVGLLYLSLGAFGVFINVVTALCFLRSAKFHTSSTFFLMAALAVTDTAGCLSNAVWPGICLVTTTCRSGKLLSHLAGYLSAVAFYCQLPYLILISCTRYVAIARPFTTHLYFHGLALLVSALLPPLLTGYACLPLYFSRLTDANSTAAYYFDDSVFSINYDFTNALSAIYAVNDFVWSATLLPTFFAINAVTIRKMRIQRNEQMQLQAALPISGGSFVLQKAEIRLTMQNIINGSWLAAVMLFYILVLVNLQSPTSRVPFVVAHVLNLLANMNGPLIYFCFNTAFRQHVLQQNNEKTVRLFKKPPPQQLQLPHR